ncbi:MAG TPA: M36 family metallopeptidase [Candidatus Limnocylindrales bacterium]|nr:M36 family metallopeptidase [Candidatus Limnocylindrales bacterium]
MISSRMRLLASLSVVGLAFAAISPGLAGATPPPSSPGTNSPVATPKGETSDKESFYDSRKDPAVAKLLGARAATQAANPKAGVRSLKQELGIQGIVSIDPLTSTARAVGRLDGFLTGPSKKSAKDVALSYVASHPDVFGLDADAISRLQLRRDYVDVEDTHHLSFVQQVAGIPVFGNGLQANVTKKGQLINVVGSPVTSLPTAASAPGFNAEKARTLAVTDMTKNVKDATVQKETDARQTAKFSNGDRAALVYFQTAGGLRLAWQTLTSPTTRDLFTHVIDAESGRVLYRQSLVSSDNGLAWDNYPGALAGGVQQPRNLTRPGWLPNNSPRLAGNVAHVYNDANDDNLAQASEEITPNAPRNFNFPFTNFNAVVGPPCAADLQCSWDPATANSWQTNRNQNAVQVLYFIGKFHDHLNAAPIGFTRSAGNFEAVDGDAINAEVDDGSDLAGGFPDSLHTDNANMATPPDGIPPRMQMYLFHDPADPTDPFLASNGGDTADIIYHEYTHGLSNRLVVDALGNSTLGNVQAGSMGEAWSDWYALDFLVKQGFEVDTAAPGEVRVGKYVDLSQDIIRSQPLDCPVGSTSELCHGTPGAGPGGYTYGDFGRVAGQPEVHADGEIWAETLWDLRGAIGSRLAESLVTRAMELSPNNPSFLDMRNSILMADQVVNAGKANKKIWSVFAGRGMGYFAGSVDGDDTAPVESFSPPPPPGTPTGTLSGVVSDQDTGTPVANAVVGFGGHASGFPGDLIATTDANGRYTITGIVAGTYPSVFAKAPGFDTVTATVSIASHPNVKNWSIRRDWAALSGGGTVADFNGPDYTIFGCGPTGAIDQSLGTGWGSNSDIVGSPPAVTPKFIIIRLPQSIDIAEIKIDPGNTCGDGGSASTSDFTLETSSDGVTFTVAASGTFVVADRHRLNTVPLAPGSTANVQFVRFTMRGVQVPGGLGSCPGPFSGCSFMDMSEMAVYGAPAS